jgi:hypothetical protein
MSLRPIQRFWMVCRPTGSYPETGLEEINGDLPEADFLTASVHFSGLRVIQPSGKKRRFKKGKF